MLPIAARLRRARRVKLGSMERDSAEGRRRGGVRGQIGVQPGNAIQTHTQPCEHDCPVTVCLLVCLSPSAVLP